MAYKTVNLGGTLQQQYETDPRLLMAMQGMQQGGSYAPVYSPMEGIARALSGVVGAYTAKKLRGEYEDKQADQYSKIADVLAPPVTTVTEGPQETAKLSDGSALNYSTPQLGTADNPNRQAIMSALSSGLLDSKSVAPAVAEKLGFGKTSEYDTTPRTGINPATGKREQFVQDKAGNTKWLGIAPETKQEATSSGVVWNPYDATVTGRLPDTQSPERVAQEESIRAAGRPNMSVNVSADKSFGTQLGENAGKILDASHSAAAGGIQTLHTVAQIKDALATGKVTAGPGASAIQFFNQVSGGDPQKVVATRQAIQGLAQLTLAGRAALKGQGQISDYEGKLLAKASSGDIDSMTVGEINTIADVADRNARISIRLNKQNVDKARRAAPGNQDLVDFYQVDEPAAYKPPAPAAGGPPRITGDADFNALPSGTVFIGPDGKTRRKP